MLAQPLENSYLKGSFFAKLLHSYTSLAMRAYSEYEAIMQASIADELIASDFGDKRLTTRAMALAKVICENPEASINAACGSFSDSKAAYRFFQNDKVSPENILSGHIERTLSRIGDCQEVLVIQDTTELIYTHYPSIQGLGHRLRNKKLENKDVKGLLLHSSLLVSCSGVPLGILKQSFFTYDQIRKNREQEESNVAGINKTFPIEQKCSFRWIAHFLEAERLLRPLEKRAIYVADRESDIYEFIQTMINQSSSFVIRSCNNRRTHEGPRFRDASTIDAKLRKAPPLGEIEVVEDKKKTRCTVKAIRTLLKPPQRKEDAKSNELLPISVGIVEVKEQSTSEGALHWRLISNLNSINFQEAVEVVNIYKRRWVIESFHRILKSGFSVEKARLSSQVKLEKLAALLSIVSWFIFWLYQLGRSCPKLEADTIFDATAIEVLRISARQLKVAHKKKFTLHSAILTIARLGGFLARKRDGPPGMICIWRGWRCLHERLEFKRGLIEYV